jgi:hypothetical protein
MDPALYGPGEGEHHDAGPAQIFVKATGEHTAGSFFLAESAEAAQSAPLSPDVIAGVASRYDFELDAETQR